MGYFPLFIDLSGRNGLVAGGGKVALGKLHKLRPYGPRLTVAAPYFLPEITEMAGVELLLGPFREELLEDRDFVVAATDNREENHRIAALCKERGILVNAVDAKADCSFLFPALIKKGNLSVGISTEGCSPTAAVYMKERMEACLPPDIERILTGMEYLRPRVAETVPEGKRGAVLRALLNRCLERGCPEDGPGLEQMLAEVWEEWIHG